jgi:hypothetical protein
VPEGDVPTFERLREWGSAGAWPELTAIWPSGQ